MPPFAMGADKSDLSEDQNSVGAPGFGKIANFTNSSHRREGPFPAQGSHPGFDPTAAKSAGQLARVGSTEGDSATSGLGQIEFIAVWVSEEGQPQLSSLSRPPVKDDTALLQPQDHLFDRLVNTEANSDRSAGSRHWAPRTRGVKTEDQPVPGVNAGPMVSGPEIQPKAKDLGVKRHRTIHVTHVNRRVPAPDHK